VKTVCITPQRRDLGEGPNALTVGIFSRRHKQPVQHIADHCGNIFQMPQTLNPNPKPYFPDATNSLSNILLITEKARGVPWTERAIRGSPPLTMAVFVGFSSAGSVSLIICPPNTIRVAPPPPPGVKGVTGYITLLL